MARIEWIKHRLNNWALWKVRESSGGLGFATSSIFLANRVDSSRDAPLPVDEADASKTDQAVESLKPDKLQLYTTLQLVYVKGIGIRAVNRSHFIFVRTHHKITCFFVVDAAGRKPFQDCIAGHGIFLIIRDPGQKIKQHKNG